MASRWFGEQTLIFMGIGGHELAPLGLFLYFTSRCSDKGVDSPS